MANPSDLFIASIQPPLDNPRDMECLRRMCTYLGRSNLWPQRWHYDEQGHLECIFANEAERFAFTIDELMALWQGLQRGERIDWGTLRQLR